MLQELSKIIKKEEVGLAGLFWTASHPLTCAPGDVWVWAEGFSQLLKEQWHCRDTGLGQSRARHGQDRAETPGGVCRVWGR